MHKHEECFACKEGCYMAHMGRARCNGDICQEAEAALKNTTSGGPSPNILPVPETLPGSGK